MGKAEIRKAESGNGKVRFPWWRVCILGLKAAETAALQDAGARWVRHPSIAKRRGVRRFPPLSKRTDASIVQVAIRSIRSPLWLFIFVVAAMLTGCTVGPNYHEPPANAPSKWASPLNGGETNGPSADVQWWKSFRDPELDSLIARAAESNLNIRAAFARVRQARFERGIAKGGFWPTLDTTASYSYNRASATGLLPIPPGTPLEANLYQAGFDSAWELDIFGATRRSVEAASAELAGAEFGRRNLLLSVFAEVARNYVQARSYERRLDVLRKNIKVQEDTLSLTRDLFSKGLVSELDVQQSESLLATTEAEEPAFDTGFRGSAYRLAVLMGQPPGALLDELAANAPVLAEPPVVPVGLPSDLIHRRPDIQQAERQLAAATARIGVAKADLFPQFSLTGNIGLESISASDWFTAGSRFWTVGPAAQWRLFEAGRIRANIHLQTARQEEALAVYEQSVLTAFEDVENALTAYAHEQVRRQSLTRAVEADEKAAQLAEDLYRHGLADFLRVLESQRSLYQSQDALIESDQIVSSNLIALYKALGGGWKEGRIKN
jgi:NodT family efflux transporter outer membrane factor (OMF) lipoprotein